MSHQNHWSPADDDSHDSFFPANDPSSSSFQVNPASQLPRHPAPPSPIHARPRVSSQTKGNGSFSMKSMPMPTPKSATFGIEDLSDMDSDGGGEDIAATKVTNLEICREMLKTSTGRDKILKLLQYTMRVYLIFHFRAARVFDLSKNSTSAEVARRFKSTMSGFSLARKCLILFNWVTPLIEITQPITSASITSSLHIPRKPKNPSMSTSISPKKPKSGGGSLSSFTLTSPTLLHRFLHAPPPLLLDLFNGVADDLYTFSRIGLVGKKLGERAERAANWAWFAATLAGLVEVGAERTLTKGLIEEVENRLYAAEVQIAEGPLSAGGLGATRSGRVLHNTPDEAEFARLHKQLMWLQISRIKFLMDLTFVSYDLFSVQRAREPIMAFSGLLSGILSAAKLYDKHRTQLAKA